MTDEQFAWWLVGLVDGEGHFGITKVFKPTGQGPYYRCVFRVSLAIDDLPLLTMAHGRTAWGGLYEYANSSVRLDGKPRRRVGVWTVNTKQVGEVASFFDAYQLQSKKALEFATWGPAAHAHAARIRRGRGNKDEVAESVLSAAYSRLKALRRPEEALPV